MRNPDNGMKMLFLDIETTPIDAWVWQVWSENIGPHKIKEPTRMLSWAAKWEGEDYAYFAGEHTHDREVMVNEIYTLMDAADVIVTYNGKRFDIKHLNREFLLAGLPPPTNYKQIDLLQVVKSTFSFPHNKLDYVAQALDIGEKVEHNGMPLWLECMEGNPAAWKKMEEYNIQDVLLLEELYGRLQGWIRNHPNRILWIEDQDEPRCPNCLSENVVRKGIERPANVNAYQRYKCRDCGANSRGRKIIGRAGRGALAR